MSLVTREFTTNDSNYENDIKQKMLEFFTTIFRGIDFNKEYIRIAILNDSFTRITFYNDFNRLVNYCYNNRYNNLYFQLATVKTDTDGKEDNLCKRYCLALDYDKKELGENFGIENINHLFINELKIYAHFIVNSGHGYHVYTCIEPTTDIIKVNSVQKVLANKTGADLNAVKTTQLLRVPYTYNMKNKEDIRQVKLIKSSNYNDERFNVKNIDFYYDKNCNSKIQNTAEGENKKYISIEYALGSSNLPLCIEKILKEGSEEGNRYYDLTNIVVALRLCGKSLNYIKDVVKEWATKSNFNDKLDYRTESIYHNKKSLEIDCKGCKHKCVKEITSNFEYKPNEPLINVDIKMLSKLNKPVGSVEKMKKLTGNEFLVYTVIKNANKELFTSDIVKLMTFKKKCRISKPTLQKALKGLTDKDIINCKEVGGNKGNVYSLVPHKIKETELITVSYFATILCLSGGISADELKFYYYLRYLLEKQNVLDSTTGNILKLRMSDIAREYGVTKAQVSNLISELIEGKILEIYSVTTSKTNGYDYYTYKLIK